MFFSIMGMYEYDPSVFDGLDAPSYENPDTHEITVVDKNKLIQNICLQCAELELVYPAFDTMKLAIGVWSASEYRIWQKLYATTMVEYNPIWNVDANVEHTNRLAGSDNRTITPNTTDEHSVTGFNTATWQSAEKDVKSGTVTDNATDDHTTTFKERRTGNIGVTSTQSMLQQERELAEFSIINYITMSFKRRFCLMVY